MIDVPAVRARLDAATPGPWTRWPTTKYLTPQDMGFIAHARSDVAGLCDEVEWLRGVLQELSLPEDTRRVILVGWGDQDRDDFSPEAAVEEAADRLMRRLVSAGVMDPFVNVGPAPEATG